MATRRYVMAELLDGGRTLAMRETNARNSAIRASEDLVRDYARLTGEPFTGDKPERANVAGKGDTYSRAWVGDWTGSRLRVEVVEVFS